MSPHNPHNPHNPNKGRSECMSPNTQNPTHNLAVYAQPPATQGHLRLCVNREVVREVLRKPGNSI